MDTSNACMELLAPAGGWEQLECALRFGADAVYLAAERFGMRQRASNFKLSEMDAVAERVHSFGAKLHVACNTVMHDADIAVLPSYFEALEQAGVDALIIEDLGALRLARAHAPSVAIHASTQASVSNAQAALTWHELGASRIVCAREMSLDGIRAMRDQVPRSLELEAFAHGSMCMAYSGRCLISDYVNGRSALSGHCTQPCRWNYALVEQTRPGTYFPIEESQEGSFILNSKDLNMLSHLDDMQAAGVDSVKIEGRNKKAYYVATVVNAYRNVLDGADPRLWERELDTVSHRPYHTGFYYGPAHQTPESDEYIRPCEWVASVLECGPEANGAYEVTVLCKNRFTCEDVVEAVQPGLPVARICIGRIEHSEDPGAPYELRTQVEVANRNGDVYLLETDRPLAPHSLLRAYRP